MYTIELKKAPNQDASDAEIDFIFQDIANSISEVQHVKSVKRDGNLLLVDASSSVEDLKKAMKHIFSHHFDFVRLSHIEPVK